MVLVSGAGMAVYVLTVAAKEGRPQERTFKSLWAIGLVTLGLAIFADFVPDVAGPFALLVLIAMAVRNTGVLGSVVGGPGSVRPLRGKVDKGGTYHAPGHKGPGQLDVSGATQSTKKKKKG